MTGWTPRPRRYFAHSFLLPIIRAKPVPTDPDSHRRHGGTGSNDGRDDGVIEFVPGERNRHKSDKYTYAAIASATTPVPPATAQSTLLRFRAIASAAIVAPIWAASIA